MFDNAQMNVSMNGEEYIKYKESKKFKLSKGVKQALPFFILAFLGVFLAAVLLNDIFYVPPETESWFTLWYGIAQSLAAMSWGAIAKFSYLYFAPFIVLAVLISWVVHGVGFFIVRG